MTIENELDNNVENRNSILVIIFTAFSTFSRYSNGWNPILKRISTQIIALKAKHLLWYVTGF